MANRETRRRLSRREFIKGISVGAAGLGLAGAGAWAAEPSTGMKYRKLGRTGLMVSEIGLGTDRIDEQNFSLIPAAIERGVTYIDTAPMYPMQGKGKTEEVIGRVLKQSSVRDKVVLCTKATGLKLGGDMEKELTERLDASLKRLQTDRVDIFMAPHGATAPEHVQSAAIFSAFEKLKKQGKARFLGVSTHINYAENCLAAIRSGYYDVVMSVINISNTSAALLDEARALREARARDKGLVWMPLLFDMRPVVAEAAKKNVGLVAMKAVNGVVEDIRSKVPSQFGQASGMNLFQMCYKWVLSQESVATIVANMVTMEMLEQDVQVPGKKLARADAEMLERAVASAQVCRLCGTCSANCPRGVKVADILRFEMYHRAYGTHEAAVQGYRALAAAERASACQDCGTCEAVCPAGVRVRARLHEAHRRLA
ncbi:MAG: twin-arginine translocation signal domain-containing protein [Planctomycetes bacterium]|nr:twin-arginine translocation signal domain-containing protein [Planctomycetota bacterium]